MTEQKKRFLVKAAFAPSTIKQYTSSLNLFLSWCRDQGEDPQTVDQVDECFVDWLHDLYEERGADGSGKSLATKALCGLHVVLPQTKAQLPQTALALRGWNKKHPSVSYPPLTWELSCLIAVRLAKSGHMPAAVGVLLAFDCYLRIGELLGLRKEDVADVKDARLGLVPARINLRLKSTKTGPNKWVQMGDPQVERLVRLVVKVTADGQKLFPYSSDEFRKLFKQACFELGLSARYVPHSLRHGAATRAFQLGVKLEDIMLRGRWASSKSARTYIQSGPALLLATDVPIRAAQLGLVFSHDIVLSLACCLSC
jgi:integrase